MELARSLTWALRESMHCIGHRRPKLCQFATITWPALWYCTQQSITHVCRLNMYILDYLRSKNLGKTAEAFVKEVGSSIDRPVGKCSRFDGVDAKPLLIEMCLMLTAWQASNTREGRASWLNGGPYSGRFSSERAYTSCMAMWPAWGCMGGCVPMHAASQQASILHLGPCISSHLPPSTWPSLWPHLTTLCAANRRLILVSPAPMHSCHVMLVTAGQRWSTLPCMQHTHQPELHRGERQVPGGAQ
jgi:hypothetical protein